MRPVESLVVHALLLTLLVFAALLPRTASWMRLSAPGTLLIAVGQVLVEGARWLMIPAYIIAGVLLLIWLFQTTGPARPGSAPMARGRLARLIATGLATLGLAVAVALSMALPVFRFPLPTGPWAIGAAVYHWTDPGRAEIFSADPVAPREVMAQIWYTATEPLVTEPAPYVQDAAALWAAQARLHGLPPFALMHLGYVTTNATQVAPVSNERPAYPVLVFLEGLTGYRQMSSFQVEHLVSHGYIVMAIDHPYVAAMDLARPPVTDA